MKDEIKKFFKGEVEDSEEVLKKYSRDASIFEIRPKVVLFPMDAEDVKGVVKWVNDNKEQYPELAITARCAGTCMSGGAIGESIILDFTRHMNKIIGFDGESVVVQPGMFYRDFEKETLAKGLVLPCFTASRDLNTVGGMFGNNSAGERTLLYGKTEDYVMETKVVFADGNEYTVKPLNEEELQRKIAQGDYEGNIYKKIYELVKANEEDIKNAKPNVHKNSAGYYIWNVIHNAGAKNSGAIALGDLGQGTLDALNSSPQLFDLNKVIVGSQGTLGIATEIKYRLVRPKPYSKLVVVFLRDMALLPDLVNKVLKYKPQTLESYDDKTFFLVLKYFIGFAKLMGLKNLFKLAFSFGPETIMTLRHGFPRLILLVEFTGDTQEEADKKARETIEELKSIKKIGVHLTRNEFEATKYWTIRHQAFNLIRYHLKKSKSEPFIDDVIVRPEKLPEFFPEIYKILNEYKKHMTFAIGGHAGDGNLHIYTLLDPHDPSLRDIVFEVSEKVYNLVARLEGSITAEHNDGIVRTMYLNKMYSDKILKIFRDTKLAFDSKNILNPGKKVDLEHNRATKEYIGGHIAK